MKTIPIANQKGGVGKTTLTVLLADAIAGFGDAVLVVDLDPQANLTSATRVDTAEGTIADVLADPGRIPISTIASRSVWGFDVAPSELTLASKERSRRLADEHDLATALGTARYDTCLVDCPPSLGVLTINALTAADAVLIVTEPSAFALDGVNQLVDTIMVVRRHYNPRIQVAGVVVNQLDATREARRQLLAATRTLGALVVEPFLPRRAAIREAVSTATPLDRHPAARGQGLDRLVASLAREVTSRV